MTDIPGADMGQKEQQLQEAKERIAGALPLVPNPPSCIIDLPRGLRKGDSWEAEAEVRELNGEDEESLARVRDMVSYFDAVMAHGTVRIGEVDLSARPVSERQGILGQLLVGERERLLLGIIQATYGDTKTIGYTCTLCSVEQDVELILSEDFKPKELENPYQVARSFTTSKGDMVEYRLVTGGDQLEALNKKGASVAEQNSILMSRVIVKVNGQLPLDPLAYARKLSLRDRQEFVKLLLEQQPGIDLTLTTSCAGCGGEQVLPIGWGDLFRS